MVENRFLRVFYTKNDSSQLTLARSRGLVPVYPFTSFTDDSTNASGSSTPQTRYATVSLRACIDTLSASSPDLIHDHHRDYSVYHLDPLESDPDDVSTQNLAKNGVSVGLGLISELRKEEQNIAVSGRVIRLKTGLDAMEVVFQLREVPKQGSSTTGVDYSDPNIAAALERVRTEAEAKLHSRKRKPKNPQASISKRLHPITARCEAEKLMAGGNFYGRGTKSEAPTSNAPSPESYPTPVTSVASTPCSSQTSPLPQSSQTSASSPATSFAPPSDPPNSDGATILAVLSLIDSSPDAVSKVEGNPTLQSALRNLLQQYWNNSTSSSQPSAPADQSQDDEVVILDKENVNPSDFRRRAELEAMKLAEMSHNPSAGPGVNVTCNGSQGLGLGGRSNTMSSDASKACSLEEQLSSRDRSSSGSSRKGKEKAHPSTSKDSSRTYRLPIYTISNSSTEPWSSPPRPRRSDFDENAAAGSSRAAPIVIPDSPLAPIVPASSPIRGKKQPLRKRYVVPEWARTTTATKPRFSEQALKTMEEAERQREEDRKVKRAKWTSRSKSTSALTSATSSATAESKNLVGGSSERPQTPPPRSAGVNGPLASQPTFSLPVCAAASSPLAFLVPKTPPRKRPRSPSQSPLARGGMSLFTPKTPKANRDEKYLGSPLFSPSPIRPRKSTGTSLQTPKPRGDNEDDAISGETAANDNDVDIGSASDTEEYPRKQIWPGLPPSSPPPPSSPMQSDDPLPPADTPYDEGSPQLPMATSDTEEDDFLSPREQVDDDQTSSNSDAMDDMDSNTPMNSDAGECHVEHSDQQTAEDIATFLAQYTNLSSDTPVLDEANLDWNQLFQDQSQTSTNKILDGEDANMFWNEQLKYLIAGSGASSEAGEVADAADVNNWLTSSVVPSCNLSKCSSNNPCACPYVL
ncbi:hypothetical protein Moror_1491 [Moniliophthora roreri MCA 2997]|uniref:Ams2/SPT21 N-terminal domain-containing protein n=1 Tax=Moniliophthora roreri (strain MCA 2997) TaxID=1381753 RepID=V2YPR9_MONRO|nr:hypothetical protein Moror_1491 [Moniliophthora roreri MCA 2997]